MLVLAAWYGSSKSVQEIVAPRSRVVIDRSNPRRRLDQIHWPALLDKEHLDAMASEACEICGVEDDDDDLCDLVRGIVEHDVPVADVLERLELEHKRRMRNE